MAKRAKPEEIIAKLREVDVRLSRGETTGQPPRARTGPRKLEFSRDLSPLS